MSPRARRASRRAQRKAQRLELAKTRMKGDFITCGGGPVMAGKADKSFGSFGHLPQRTAAEIEADRRAREKAEWNRNFERKYCGW